MAELRDVVAYLCTRYPHKQELSKGRLAKMVYLGELWSAMSKGRRLTDRTWELRRRGPFLKDIEEFPSKEPCFKVIKAASIFGDPMDLVTLQGDVDCPTLTQDDIRILDRVIKESAPKEWEELCWFVSSTYASVCQTSPARLDLAFCADPGGHAGKAESLHARPPRMKQAAAGARDARFVVTERRSKWKHQG
jgi:hypothetical protein